MTASKPNGDRYISIEETLSEILTQQGQIMAELSHIRKEVHALTMVRDLAVETADRVERHRRRLNVLKARNANDLAENEWDDSQLYEVPEAIRSLTLPLPPSLPRRDSWWKKPTLRTALAVVGTLCIAAGSACVTYATTHVKVEVRQEVKP